MAVTFDLFGTLVRVDPPSSPASAVGRELAERGVSVPENWSQAYAEPHVDAPDGAEVPLPDHVGAALESCGVGVPEHTVDAAVAAAFDAPVETRPNAVEAVAAAADAGRVGVLSNCSVPGLVERALNRSDLDRRLFDAVVASVDCGWRKPDRRAFEAVADALGVGVDALVHVGDDPRTDGGIEACGGTAILLDDASLSAVPERLDADAEATKPDGAGGSPCR
ncbi:HAD family hydrolase [Natronoarchaeum philippinense]|uniref:HAD family hydrolase n=1 Tax=Natronoarchaeum philippinense TaxID=558529 RepID=UPI000BE2B492|nr:HAD family hydrolase [Natronoarchaeum philippinense]